MKSVSLNHEIPCAIAHSLYRTRKRINKLTPWESQIAFQNWVAYIRPNLPEISTEERLSCPLLLCTKFHPNLESLLNHIVGCPKLDAGRYWCPRCNRKESFPEYDRQELPCHQNSLQKTGSKLKRAVVFFRHLSIRSCTRHCKNSPNLSLPFYNKEFTSHSVDENRPGECISYLTQLNDVDRTSKFELDSRPAQGASFVKPELPTPDASHETSYNRLAPQELPAIAFCKELQAEQLPQELPPQPWIPELAVPSAFSKPSDSCKGQNINISNNETTGSSDPQAQKQAALQASPTPTGHFILPPDVALSDTAMPTNEEGACSQDSPSRCPDASFLPAFAGSYRLLSLQDSAGIRETVPTCDLVEHLRHLFTLVHNEWHMRLSRSPEIRVVCMSIPSDVAFDLGLDTLLRFIVGELPRTLDITFTLMQIAITCAYSLYEDNDMNLFDELLESFLEWRYTITDNMERAVFVNIIQRVMGHQHDSSTLPRVEPSFVSSQHLAGARGSVHEQNTSHSTPHLANLTGASDIAEEQSMYVDESMLWSRLERGRAMALCWEFLEDIAHAQILMQCVQPLKIDVSYNPQHSDVIMDLETSIISQLRSYPDMGVLTDEIAIVQLAIHDGLLRNPREVEVALLYYCKRRLSRQHGHTAQRRETCRKMISFVCNQRITAAGWRNRYRANDMRVVLAIAREQQRENCAPRLPTYEDAVNDQLCCETTSHPPGIFRTQEAVLPLTQEDLAFTHEQQKGKCPLTIPTYEDAFNYKLDSAILSHPPVPFHTQEALSPSRHADPALQDQMPESSKAKTPSLPINRNLLRRTSPTMVDTDQHSPIPTEGKIHSPPISVESFLPTPPSSHGSPGSSNQRVRCPRPHCQRILLRGNLPRHIKTAHEETDKLPCRLPGCFSTFGRSDAVNKHMRLVHGNTETLNKRQRT